MAVTRIHQRRDQARKGPLLRDGFTTKLKATVFAGGVSHACIEFYGLVQITERDHTTTARVDPIQEINPDTLGADVCATANQSLVRHQDLSRQINEKTWISVFKSLHM